ncbi:MAG: hypothetical protein FDZ75_06950 [Actinobacteria bacterium]|nr:MAG: hypothetical protein FDZ75_06950 [Actinomycetota bacterium]
MGLACYTRTMGADCTAAWLGALLVTALSFVPAIMAPTLQARRLAGRVARLSLPASLAVAVWATLSSLQLTPPPGGVVVSVAYPLLLAPVGLAAWGLGLLGRETLARVLGVRVPYAAALVVGIASVAAVAVVR